MNIWFPISSVTDFLWFVFFFFACPTVSDWFDPIDWDQEPLPLHTVIWSACQFVDSRVLCVCAGSGRLMESTRHSASSVLNASPWIIASICGMAALETLEHVASTLLNVVYLWDPLAYVSSLIQLNSYLTNICLSSVWTVGLFWRRLHILFWLFQETLITSVIAVPTVFLLF